MTHWSLKTRTVGAAEEEEEEEEKRIEKQIERGVSIYGSSA